MTNLIIQGLTIGVIGMSLTFLALGILILAMVVLDRVFRADKPAEVADTGPEEQISVTARNSEDEEIAAAIVTALAYRRYMSQSGLGTALEVERSPWWAIGRVQQCPAEALQKIRGRS